MKLWQRIIQWILGPDPISSIIMHKTAALRAMLSVLAIVAGIAYLFIDRSNGIYGNDIYYLSVVTVGFITLFLNRQRYYTLASAIFLISVNTVVFLFTDNDSYYTGLYIFYICICLIGFALFRRDQIIIAVGFALVAVISFLVNYFNEATFIEKPDLSPELIKNYLAINFIVATIICISIIYFLITINYQSESKLIEQNKLLAKTNSELDQFAYSVSHDLRAPLSSVQGLINLYNRSEDPQEKEAIVAKIDSRVKTLDLFIKKILDHSRNSRLELQYESVYPAQLTHEIVSELEHMHDFGRQEIHIDIPEKFTVVTDQSRLRIILSNLISNAIKYYDVQKPNPYVKIEAFEEKDNWKLIVSDNGIGIDSSQLPKIFDMFHRANDRSEGSGLGLYIVDEVCKRLGGSINVQSKEGEGSCFEVRIPILH